MTTIGGQPCLVGYGGECHAFLFLFDGWVELSLARSSHTNHSCWRRRSSFCRRLFIAVGVAKTLRAEKGRRMGKDVGSRVEREPQRSFEAKKPRKERNGEKMERESSQRRRLML